jgi:hypothetical protein
MHTIVPTPLSEDMQRPVWIIRVWLYFQALIPGLALFSAIFVAILVLLARMIMPFIFNAAAIWFVLIKPVFAFQLRPIIPRGGLSRQTLLYMGSHP